MTSPRKTHRDLESTGDTAQVIGTAERGDLEYITVKIITVCFCHSLSSRTAGGFETHAGTCRWDLPHQEPEDSRGPQSPHEFQGSGVLAVSCI